MLEDTNSLDAPHLLFMLCLYETDIVYNVSPTIMMNTIDVKYCVFKVSDYVYVWYTRPSEILYDYILLTKR